MSRFPAIITLCVLGLSTTDALASPAWKSVPEGTLKLVRFTLTRKVQDRQPVGEVASVPCDGERVYAFAELLNKGPRQELVMVWKRDEAGKGSATDRSYRLGVERSPSWKTWSYQRATGFMKGRWTVSLRDATGAVLAQQQLTVCR